MGAVSGFAVGGEGAVAGVGQGPEVELGGGDVGVAEAFFDDLDVGAAGQQPGGVCGAEVVGSSVWAHGLTGMIRSMTARAKIRCSSAWYFTIDRADNSVVAASLTQACTTEGLIRRIGIVPKRGTKCRSR